MRLAIAVSSIPLLVALNLILFLGATTPDVSSLRPLRNGLVVVLDLSLAVSSGLLAVWFQARRRRGLALLFEGNLVLLAMAYLLGITGFRFPLPVLYAADVYWLNLYLIVLSSQSRSLLSSPS